MLVCFVFVFFSSSQCYCCYCSSISVRACLPIAVILISSSCLFASEIIQSHANIQTYDENLHKYISIKIEIRFEEPVQLEMRG